MSWSLIECIFMLTLYVWRVHTVHQWCENRQHDDILTLHFFFVSINTDQGKNLKLLLCMYKRSLFRKYSYPLTIQQGFVFKMIKCLLSITFNLTFYIWRHKPALKAYTGCPKKMVRCWNDYLKHRTIFLGHPVLSYTYTKPRSKSRQIT